MDPWSWSLLRKPHQFAISRADVCALPYTVCAKFSISRDLCRSPDYQWLWHRSIASTKSISQRYQEVDERYGEKQGNATTEAQYSTGNIELPAEKAYFIMKMEVAREIQGELLDWAKRRIWISGAIIAVIGFLGINSLVISSIYTLLREDLQLAHESTILARETAEDASRYIEKVNALETVASDVGQRFDDILLRFRAEGGNVKAGTLVEVDALRRRLEELEGLVASLGSRDNPTRVAEYRDQVETVKNQVASARIAFSENSKYFVVIHFSPNSATANKLAFEVHEILEQQGFKTAPEGSVPPISMGVEVSANRIEFNTGDQAVAVTIADTLRSTNDMLRLPLAPTSKVPQSEIHLYLWGF